MSKKKTVAALFDDLDDAHESVSRLLDLGLGPDDIGFLEPPDVRPRRKPHKSAAATALAVLSGAALGGVVGAFALGMTDVIGTTVASAVGVMFGGYAGWILAGVFVGDAPAEDENYFMKEIQEGRVLVTADVLDLESMGRAAAVLHESHALEVDSLDTAALEAELRHPVDTRAA